VSESKKSERVPQRQILGASAAVKKLIQMIEKVSAAKTNVLIIGESGTGKELVARMIHETGPLRGKPFVPVNCGAIPETLIESEMFGHRRGSFTGAVAEKQGLFEVAHGGTLFLDEVGELPLSMQVKLLRAIQERSFRKVGGTEDIKVDVRIIAATNRDLEVGVAKGTFREDLYYRLNVILLKTPPLRERKGDVPLLADAFLKKFSSRQSKTLDSFSDEVLGALDHWTWPGNVRELENIIERAVTLESGNRVELGSLPAPILDAWTARVGKTLSGDVSSEGDSGATGVPVGRDGILILPGCIKLPAAEFEGGLATKIDLTKIMADVESAYLKAALKVSGRKLEMACQLLGLSVKELKSRVASLRLDRDDG
jgi:two-component system response regulator PilR (NtrC family)